MPGAQEVPAWLDRLAQWSWRLLIVLGLGWLAIEAAATVPLVVGPMTVAIILAATLLPAVRILMRRGWTRGQASIVVAVVAWAVVVVFTVLSIVVLAKQGTEIVATSTKGSSALAGVDWPNAIASGFGGGILATIKDVLTGLAGLFVGLVLSAVLSFFVLRDGSRGWVRLTRGLSGWRHDIVDRAGTRAVEILGGYMISTGVLSAFGAGTQFVIMVVLGLPLAAPVAILSFFLGFIPYIGSFLATGVAFLITIAVGSTADIVIMVIWTVVFNIVQGSIIAPLVYGKAVSLHPAIVLLAIPAGGELAGVVGMFLAVPLLGLIAASWRSVLQVLGDRPPAPSVATDKRLLRPAGIGPQHDRIRIRGCRPDELIRPRWTWSGAGRARRSETGPAPRVSLVRPGSDPERLRLGGRELLVRQDALGVEVGQLLELRHLRVLRCRRSRGRGWSVLLRRGSSRRSRLLLLGVLLRVLLLLVMADGSGRAGHDGGGRGHSNDAASASHHRG